MTDNQKKLINLLKEMFQFEQADLDFGIYRIMRMKREEISRFIEKDLPEQITQELQSLASASSNAELEQIAKQITDAKALTVSEAIKTSIIAELEEKKKALLAKVDISAVEADVYNHLTNFFSRYYEEGDFISQRRYMDGAYAIPYEGEEVKLHWANADQYFIKTSEHFKDYTFKTAYGDTVRFKLVEAETEQDNNKANEKRFFQLYTQKSFELADGIFTIYMEYKNGEKASQDACIDEIIKAFADVQNEYPKFSALLAKADGKSLLERQLIRYTRRNTFDYFIHKDLGRFLRRELDFYIKNDVIFLDDLDEQDEGKSKVYLTKAKAIRRIARKIIAFLAQIEDFQKKLYLKKKFVVESHYCITLDRIPEAMYPEIAANHAQREEWVRLFAIDEIQGDMNRPGYSVPLTTDFLKANPYLVLDTAFFSREFKERLIESMDNLDESLDGVLIHSENFHALNILKEKYSEKISCIYIDPPYNTGDDDNFYYKDNYMHSTWLSLLYDRLISASRLMSPECPLFCSIDQDEWHRLRMLMENIFGEENYVNEIVWQKLTAAKKQSTYFPNLYEKIMVFRKSEAMRLNKIYIDSDKDDKNYPYIEEGTGRRYGSFDFTQAGQGEARYFGDKLLEPPAGKHWIWGQDKINEGLATGRIIFTSNGTPRVKRYLDEKEGNVVGDFWIDDEIKPLSANDSERIGFNTQKPLCLVKRIIKASQTSPNYVILDFFAGSGTTAHAVISLNQEDGGKRKYILVEMGEYFDTVTKPRVQRAIYSMDTDKQKGWSNGKPVSRKGSSHAFKYLRLESYEDTLNNIELKSEQYELLGSAREDYFLTYMLDAEATSSSCLLNIDRLDRPFDYKMSITRNMESREQSIDLVETFNYLIGLTVTRSHALKAFDAQFTTDQYGAVSARLTKGTTYPFKAIEGTLPNGDKALVLWRQMTGDVIRDNAVLDAYVQETFDSGRGFRKIYVNGDNNLQNLYNEGHGWRVVLIDEEMKKRLFEDGE